MFPLQDPGTPEGKNPATRWLYTAVKNGTGCHGFLAGQPTWVKCHFVGYSKPCRSILTSGSLPCHYCAAKEEPVWRGFTPWYDGSYVRCFSCITLDYREAISEIPLHAQIKLSRGKGTRDPLVIVPCLWRTTELPVSEDRNYSADLRGSLLKVWKDPELVEWCQKNRQRQNEIEAVQSDPIFFPEGTPPELANRVADARSRKAQEQLVPFEVKVSTTVDGRKVIHTEKRNGKH